MKQFACLDLNDVVIAVETLNPANGEGYEGAYAYIQVGEGGIVEAIPNVGQKWDGEAITFN
jgi:hypothetical protein